MTEAASSGHPQSQLGNFNEAARDLETDDYEARIDTGLCKIVTDRLVSENPE
ncbi:hypothetical protein [Sphingomonas sp. CARO-RG-8B-R24-01]|uniref:hypothetical protein n=1 Tax=Sphingomonas sp. CARO-RG-8B-R24-01 TaxID=2914831 RepID=UPI001F565922|nr:hypothetical protein [Sphingomonas sp. CARO-RG-8B-R24-01]